MDWIEQLFHLNLDGGSGAAEVALPVLLLAGAGLLGRAVAARWRRRPAATAPAEAAPIVRQHAGV